MIHSKKILLVEDSPLPQMIVKAVLQQLDCSVDVADTGEGSVALCIKNHYDLILMDIGLPGIDGIMAAQLIREQEKHGHHVPIIALTAHDDLAMKTKALAAGMDDYLIKPLTLQTAQAVLNQYCCQTHISTSARKRNYHKGNK
jgi:CheY-like chemotaxis protein